MLKIFIGTALPNIPLTEILYPNLGNREAENPFGEKLFEKFTLPIVEIVADVESAEYFCLPHNYNYIKNNKEYVSNFVSLAEKHSKKILVFFPGDSDEDVPVPNSVIFRNSQYGYKKKINEVIMPAYACDLGEKYGIKYRSKEALPTVGFCGWATYSTLREWLSYLFVNTQQVFFGSAVHMKGLYFRRKALFVLSGDATLKTNFRIRSSYSGSAKTLQIDSQSARREYIDNIKNSDLILSPKGDGNFSVRFFEALSLARIPLLIDTDCTLPLADEIDYDSFILRVHHSTMSTLAVRVTNFYKQLSPDQFVELQKKCRETFEKYLRIDTFFAHVLTKAFLDKIEYTRGN